MELILCEADQKLFATYFATYYPNIWFRPSWDQLRTIGEGAGGSYWIIGGGAKVAGVYLDDNCASCLFTMPPYSATYEELVEAIVRFLSTDRPIRAYCVLDEQIEAFRQAGFQVVETRLCMQRPTEKLNLTRLQGYAVRYPDKEDEAAIARLIYESNNGEIDANSFEETASSISRYFEIHKNSAHALQASSILFNPDGVMTGGCLVSYWEGLPLIYGLAVTPECRGKGLGAYMVKKAIDTLSGVSPKLRLFVTSRNKAEKLYHRLGFVSGGHYSTMSGQVTSR